MNTILPSRRLWLFDRPTLRRIAVVAGLAGAAASAHAGGQVEVAFVNPPAYADAGLTPFQRSANLQVLGDYLKTRGSAQIATGQTLKIDVLDLVLAGSPARRIGAGDVRIARGGADWPRITLRYSLTAADGQLLQSGNEVVADLDYLRRARTGSASGPLPYEKRMLSDWLKTRFPAAVPIKG